MPRRPPDFDGLSHRLLRRHVGAVPRISPISVASALCVGEFAALLALLGSNALASPKSRTFTVPSSRTLMFAGFRSRWMIPC